MVCATIEMIVSAILVDEIQCPGVSSFIDDIDRSQKDQLTSFVVEPEDGFSDDFFCNGQELSDVIGEVGEKATTSLVSVQLDILNQRNESINKLEIEYEEQLRSYTSMVHEANAELGRLERKLGDSVRLSFPYYNALDDLFSAKQSLNTFLDTFEKIQSHLRVIHDFQENFLHARQDYEIDPVWDRIANLADVKTETFTSKKPSLDREIQKWTEAAKSIELSVKDLESGNQRQIRKSRPFYDRRYILRKQIRIHERLLSDMKTCVLEAKAEYQNALKRLEVISNEIHKHRSMSSASMATSNSTSTLNEML